MVRLKEHPKRKHLLIAFARTFFPKSRRRSVKGAAVGKGQREPHQRGWKEDKKEEKHEVVVIITDNKTSQVAERR